MESTLHRALKHRHGPALGGREEVVVEGLRIDAIAPDGELVEIQLGPLSALRGKLARLLPTNRVRVVRPVIARRRIVRRKKLDGPDLSSRRSPRRGQALDIFEDLVSLAGTFPAPNLVIEVLEVDAAEIRVPCRRWPGHRVADRLLEGAGASVILAEAGDLWRLLPPLPGPFTTRELASALDRPEAFAQKVAYCLRRSGAVDVLGFRARRRLYGPTTTLAPVA
jgi:hypothetical protein